MERDFRKKQKLKEVNRQKVELAERAVELEKEAVLTVKQARLRFKEKITKMKRAAERKRRETKNQITEIRNKMAEAAMNDNRRGNVSNCDPTQPIYKRNYYCNDNFKEEPEKNKDCLESAGDFCYVCCEKEFGRNEEDLRERCYKLCDNVENGEDEKGKKFWPMNTDGT